MRCESGSVPSRCHRLLPALVRVEFPPQALLPRLPRARQPLRLLRARGLPHLPRAPQLPRLPRAPQLPRLPRAPRHLRSELEIQAGLAGVARRLPRIPQADSAGAQERLRLLQPPFLPHPRPSPSAVSGSGSGSGSGSSTTAFGSTRSGSGAKLGIPSCAVHFPSTNVYKSFNSLPFSKSAPPKTTTLPFDTV